MFLTMRHHFAGAMLALLLLCQPALALHNVVRLAQKDFASGTYIINKPGTYRLTEDISFNPNSAAALGTDAYHASMPLPEQFMSQGGMYPDFPFHLGFFAAIVIQADNVVLDLAGHRLEQSAEHALMQRFFALIELANTPFKPGQGPANFGPGIASAKHVTIKNGTLGRSAHHGIHGNLNRDVTISDVDFEDFEVAAVALNGVEDLRILNCSATNRKDVPVLGTFSAARFIKPYLDHLVDSGSTTMLYTEELEGLTAMQVREALRVAVNRVHNDVVVCGDGYINRRLHPDEYRLFHNTAGICDGNSYGFLINHDGIAVNGFPYSGDDNAKNVVFANVSVYDQHASILEVVATLQGEGPATDPVGAVFQLFNTDPDTGAPITMTSLDPEEAHYVGNVLANAQALVAKAAMKGEFEDSHLDVSRINIGESLLTWVEADDLHLADVADGFICNGDSMFHVNKGVIAFKMDAVENVMLFNTSVSGLHNYGRQGSPIVGDYDFSHPLATLPGYGGATTRAYSFAGSSQVLVYNADMFDIYSSCGNVIGLDVLTDSSGVRMSRVNMERFTAGDQFMQDDGPSHSPNAFGIHIGDETQHVAMERIDADDFSAFGTVAMIEDESGMARLD